MFKRRFLLKALLYLSIMGLLFVGGGAAGWYINEELDKDNSIPA